MPSSQTIKRHGGKSYLADWIIGLMPPHIHFVEPYFGAGSVLFRKDPFDKRHVVDNDDEGCSEVVNDIDFQLMNFWSVLKNADDFKEFKRAVEATPFSQKAFKTSLITQYGGDVAGAVNFFIRSRQSRQGLGKSFATLSRSRTRKGMNEQAASWLSAIDGLPETHERLRGVVIYTEDGIQTILREDSAFTLFYLDPPYLHSTRSAVDAFEFEMTDDDHADLLKVLTKLKGKFMLSGYQNKQYMAWAKDNDFPRNIRRIDNKASSKKTKAIRTECVWRNF